MSSIGILVLTRNEEDKIESCLRCCHFADEIIVIDSNSEDKTCELAKKYTDKVYFREFTNFLEQRVFGIDKITCDWILMLDADETISDECREDIIKFSRQDEFDALEIPRRNYLLGEWVAHSGWYPDYQVRFIRKNKLTYEKKTVHEKFGTTGKIYRLPENTSASIHHRTCDSLSKYMQKINHYTSLEAEYYVDTKEFKISRWAIFTRSTGMFTQTLFHHKGIKDGMHGFIVAGINFIYSFLLMIKIWELRHLNKNQQKRFK